MVTITGHGTVYRQPNAWLDYYRGQSLYGVHTGPRGSHGDTVLH